MLLEFENWPIDRRRRNINNFFMLAQVQTLMDICSSSKKDSAPRAVIIINNIRQSLAALTHAWDSAMLKEEPKQISEISHADVIASANTPLKTQGVLDENDRLKDEHVAPAAPLLYMAPKLVETSYGGATDDLATQYDVIPAGLVARFVSLFEDSESAGSQETPSVVTDAIGGRKRLHGTPTTIDLSVGALPSPQPTSAQDAAELGKTLGLVKVIYMSNIFNPPPLFAMDCVSCRHNESF